MNLTFGVANTVIPELTAALIICSIFFSSMLEMHEGGQAWHTPVIPALRDGRDRNTKVSGNTDLLWGI